MEKLVKIVFILLLFICLLDMPYGYFQLIRFLALLVFGYLGFLESKRSNQIMASFYFSMALLFQPFIKVALGRTIWNIVDVLVGMVLLISLFHKAEHHEKSEVRNNSHSS
ncbi:MAG: DUF6804 family protein [Bacteroidota bacterium]